MTLAEATLVTTDVEPGWRLTADGVLIGKRYLVDLDRQGGSGRKGSGRRRGTTAAGYTRLRPVRT